MTCYNRLYVISDQLLLGAVVLLLSRLEERFKPLQELLGVAYQISCHPITDYSLLRDQVGPEVGRSKTKHEEKGKKRLWDLYVYTSESSSR